MDREAEDFRKKTMRVLIMQLNSISVMDLVAYGGFGLGVVLGLQEYLNQHITFMMFVFIVMISIEFFLPLRMLGSYFHIDKMETRQQIKFLNYWIAWMIFKKVIKNRFQLYLLNM